MAKHLFEKCIRAVLREKTVVMVTHQLQYLSQCDHVLLMHEGTIAAVSELILYTVVCFHAHI